MRKHLNKLGRRLDCNTANRSPKDQIFFEGISLIYFIAYIEAMDKQKNPPKSHHYVFQKYLSYFSPDKINVFRYEKDTRKEKFLPIKTIATINNYYTYRGKTGVKNTSLENPFFSDFEGLYPKLICHLEERKPLNSQYDYLICIMAIMHARVPKQRNHIGAIVKDLHGKVRSLGDPSENLDLELLIMNMKLYANIMTHSHFWIGVANNNSAFITSDNPAGNAYLPLTAKFCLFSSSEKKSMEYVCVDKDFVNKINQITFENTDRYVFSYSSLSQTSAKDIFV